MTQTLTTPSVEEKVDIYVRKHKDGKYSWALPSLGALDTYSLSYMEGFMKNRKLKYVIVPAKEEEEIN